MASAPLLFGLSSVSAIEQRKQTVTLTARRALPVSASTSRARRECDTRVGGDAPAASWQMAVTSRPEATRGWVSKRFEMAGAM
jgi:hypothetical protein